MHGADVVESERLAALVAALAQDGPDLGDVPCCAHCAHVVLDPTVAPENPHRLLTRGSGCPISIVAYRARVESDKGKRVEIVPELGKVPGLIVDGETIDPLKDYKQRACAC